MKCFKFVIAMVISLGSLAQAATIHILPSAEIIGSHFTLGNIATISAASPKEELTLSSLSLGVLPADQSSLTLTAPEISERLRTHMTELKSSQIKIPEKIVISKKDSSITVDRVKDQIEKIVKGQLPDPSWEYEISEIKLAPIITQLKASAFQVIPTLARPRGVFSFELLTTEHGMPRRFWITAKVLYFSKVAILSRQIPAHTRFLSTDVEWKRKEVTFLNDVPATPADATTGLARMTLSPGTLLLRSHLEREMALKFGDQVDLILGDDGMAIMTKGIAQQNGYLGDSVKVRSLATDKVLDGVITARGVVNVRY